MNRGEAANRIKKLTNEINRHRYLYHVLNRQEISDAALDSLKHELAKLEEQFPDLISSDSPTQRVAGKPFSGFKKVKHFSSMLSLNDAFSEKEMYEWETKIKKLLMSPVKFDYFSEIKVDGFAISLVYENGMLKTGSTRGDGITGEDVTQNLKTIDSIPLKLEPPENIFGKKSIKNIIEKYPRVKTAISKIPKTLEIRGEVYMSKRAFEEVNKEQKKLGLARFANPRNIAAGSIRQLDPKITASRKLDFLAYDLVTDLGQETHEEEHLIAKLFGFKTVELSARCENIEEVAGFWKKVLSEREKLPHLIDGIVTQVNSGKLFERLGVVGKAPRGAIAFKFPAKETTTIIKDIIVQIGRTGVLTPVALLEPVEIEGVTVSRATLHNLDEINRLDARVGDTAVIQRAGDVIPGIVKILKNLRPKHAKKFQMPENFCGQKVVRRPGEVAHRVQHPEKCDLVEREKFYHFVSKKAFDIKGLGPKIIDRLIDEKLARDPADLFLLKEGNIKPLERFAERSAENLINAIQSKKEIELPKFIYSLGILHVGEETAILLSQQIPNFQIPISKPTDLKKFFEKLSLENMQKIRDIGPVVGESIVKWFQKKENGDFLERLTRVGVRVKSQKSKVTNQKLKGLTFVLTGTLKSISRDEAKNKIRELGGEISENVSKKTDYVVVGHDPGSKLEKAKKLGVKIMEEKEFMKITNFYE